VVPLCTYIATHREFWQPNGQKREELKIGKDSKTVYGNDSYNLNTIPFDVENIIEKISKEDIK
jgi:hypothetical protein